MVRHDVGDRVEEVLVGGEEYGPGRLGHRKYVLIVYALISGATDVEDSVSEIAKEGICAFRKILVQKKLHGLQTS